MAEKDTLSLLISSSKLRSGRMSQWHEASLSAVGEVGVQVQIPAAGLLAVYLYFFFVFVFFHFYPFACFRIFSLLTLFSFAGFLR